MPVSRPTVTNSAENLYRRLAPLIYEDEQHGWPLLVFCEALINKLQEVEDLVRDTDDGPGWSSILDVDRAPYKALPWLGQFVGVTTPERLVGELEGAHATRVRNYIKETGGFKRGTLEAVRGAAKQHLTGNKTVYLYERYNGNAYQLRVVTFTTETPNPALTEAAIRLQKPAGIILFYNHVAPNTYDALDAAHATYDDMDAAYATYDEMDAS